MPSIHDRISSLFRERFPTVSDGELEATVMHLLAGERVSLGDLRVGITFGDHANLVNSTISIGDVTYQVVLPEPPDPLKAALMQYAAMPLDTPAPRNSPGLPSGSRLPFHPLPTFVGRESELVALATALSAQRTLSLVPAIASGMMGVGKTTLALEFAHRYGCYFMGGVFWIDCADASNVPISIAHCGLAMGLFSAITHLEQDSAAVVRAWHEAIPRLLIFDNCEDPTILTTYAPTSGGSRVLVTARRTNWGRYPTLAVGVLARPESIALLQTLVAHLTSAEADEIAAFVGDLPLGLHLAGSYLDHYQQSAATYLTDLDVTHRSFAGRGVQTPALEMPARTEINLLTIIQHATQSIASAAPIDTLARATLDVLCQLAPGESVPFDMLEPCLPEAVDHDDLIDAVVRLRTVGLIEQRAVRQISLHRMVHQAVTATHATPSTQERVEKFLLTWLYDFVQAGYPFAQPAIVTHVAWLTERAFSRTDDAAVTLMSNLAILYEKQARFADVERLQVRALQINEAVLGRKHIETTRSLNNLASFYTTMGRYAEAEPLLREVLQIRTEILGSDHPATITSLNNLAYCYANQKRFAEAEPLHQEALRLRKATLGRDHPDTARSLNNLAFVYSNQGRFAEAEPLFQDSLEIRETILGLDHPDTATSLNNLAGLYERLGRFSEAQALYERAFEIHQAVFGLDHPDTAASLNNLANLNFTQTHYPEARTFYEQALAVFEACYGPHHPDTQTAKENLHRCQQALLNEPPATGDAALDATATEIHAFLATQRWEDARMVVEHHADVLLSDLVLAMFDTEIAEAKTQPNPNRIAMLIEHRDILLECREHGIAPTFAKLTTAKQSLIAVIQAFLDAPNSRQGQAIVEDYQDLLLSDEALELFTINIEQATAAGRTAAANDLIWHRDLLLECREHGIVAAFAASDRQNLVQQTIAALLGTPADRHMFYQDLTHYQSASSEEQAFVAAIQAMLLGADMGTMGQSLPPPFDFAWHEIQAGVELRGLSLVILGQLIDNTVAACTTMPEQRDTWQQNLRAFHQQLTVQQHPAAALVENIIALLTTHGDPTGLGANLDGIYARTWNAILNALRTTTATSGED